MAATDAISSSETDNSETESKISNINSNDTKDASESSSISNNIIKTQKCTNKDYVVRELELNDFNKEYINLLSQLTVVGNISKDMFINIYNKIKSYKKIFVIEDTINKLIIGSGSVIIEHKFIRNGSCVAHIEDIVTHKKYRKQGLGRIIVNKCVQYAKELKCYKVILDCKQENMAFYTKVAGFKEKERHMALYLNE
mmetsp:Transcript_27472/g.33534  ORF Transcript_27472/g.33534 Transcript_27472/m.33534 type:complete len:197 (-) Transcript_27472:108-698(-)